MIEAVRNEDELEEVQTIDFVKVKSSGDIDDLRCLRHH
jgi:hypothetical protein